MANKFQRSVSIIGVGCTPFGDVLETPELQGMTERELASWAAIDAMRDAGISSKDVDAFYIGHCLDEQVSGSINTAAAVADWIGMRNKPGLHQEAACATGGTGLWLACQAVASGMYRIVMSVGVEILRSKVIDGKPPFMRQPLSASDNRAMTLTRDRAYMDDTVGFGSRDTSLITYGKAYGLSVEQLEEVSVAAAINAHHNASLNPLAPLCTTDLLEQARAHGFIDEVSYMTSDFNPKVGLMTRASDFYVHADGASAIIVCPTELAKNFRAHPIDITGIAVATANLYHSRGVDCESDVAAYAAAFDMAGVDPATDIDYMYVHDPGISGQYMGAETAGYLPRGGGWKAVLEGRTAIKGDKPINTSGGRTAMGHAYAASVGGEIAEAVWQMRGLCGPRQITPAPEVSAVYGLGGSMTSVAAVLQTA